MLEIWGFRNPQGQCCTFNLNDPSLERKVLDFIGSGGSVEFREIHGPGTVNASLPSLDEVVQRCFAVNTNPLPLLRKAYPEFTWEFSRSVPACYRIPAGIDCQNPAPCCGGLPHGHIEVSHYATGCGDGFVNYIRHK
jgi:hypothetical protein